MEFLEARLVEEKNRYVEGEKRIIPRTYFSLSSEEQALYAIFRSKHEKLSLKLEQDRGKGWETKYRDEGEKELSDLFSELVGSTLKESGLKLTGSFTCYGNPRETMVHTPTYAFSKEGKSSNSSIEFDVNFLTQDESISCRSAFAYKEKFNQSKKWVVNDILRRLFEKKAKNNTSFPIISPRGSFFDFAPIHFASTLINLAKNVLDKVSPEKMNELSVLYRSYSDELNSVDSGNKDAEIRAETFRMAYGSSLDIAIIELDINNK